ncbi:DNA/RNA polymerase [Ascobolus immersus RN42]|uniref:DNA polymerase kappa n=1 Tax=Ascobolus immersus RN42 TaxID=1160509 RepID=A0A3N4I0U8_ASCIM|nr:DNA/RNA polymerase [Ascobolus immersus RN42]
MRNDTQMTATNGLEYDSDDEFKKDAIEFKLRNSQREENDDSEDNHQETAESATGNIDDEVDDKPLAMDGEEKEYEIKTVKDYEDTQTEKEKPSENQQIADGVEPSTASTAESSLSSTNDHEFIKPSLPSRSGSPIHVYCNKDEADEDTPGCTQTRNFSLFSEPDAPAHSDESPEGTGTTNNDESSDEDSDEESETEESSSPPKRRRMFAPDDYREASPDKALHTSLHHALLGQSLTKNGQESVDQERVAQIIYEATKGSAFFLEEQRKDQRLTEKIEKILALKAQLDKTGYKRETRMADEKLKKLEATRDLSQIIVQVDCDAFYASVEELDNPSLKEIPFGVGQGGFGVLTTANYRARKFGVRSGMAEHVAKKLCPQLTIIPPDYRKYLRKSREIRAVLSGYDDRLEASSIDECYLNITDYCEATGRDPESVVAEMRQKVAEATLVTVSAGITPNDLLSKIASNRNKPNGQFRVLPTREACMEFMAELPCRKVPGIGKSWERQLSAIGIQTVRDIYPMRGLLEPLFKPAMANFLLQVYLGLGRTNVQPSKEYERKGVGTERTFAAIQGHDQLVEKLKHIAGGLERDMAAAGAVGRKLTLRLKLTNFQAFTRQRQLPRAINKQEDIVHFAMPLLKAYEDEFGPDLKIRLLGLHLNNLSPVPTSEQSHKPTSFYDLGNLEADIVKRGVNMEMGRVPSLPESEYADLPPMQISPRPVRPEKSQPEKEEWACPICGKGVEADDKVFNEHVDACLNKDAIKEVVRGLDDVPKLEPPAKDSEGEKVIPTKKPPSTPSKTERKRFFDSPTSSPSKKRFFDSPTSSPSKKPSGSPAAQRKRFFDSPSKRDGSPAPVPERKRFFQSPSDRAEKRSRTEPPDDDLQAALQASLQSGEGRLPPPPKMLMLDKDNVVRGPSKSPRGKRKREAVGLQVAKEKGVRGIESFFKK